MPEIEELKSEIAALRNELADTKTALESSIAELRSWQEGLNGQGGIDVAGNTITFNKNLQITGTCDDDGNINLQIT